MAERRPRGQGLERVLGTGALFSTAYGNVGSSIYYALGLVAVYALGMTPIVFVISGLIFVRPPRLQRVLVVLRRLGPDAQLHHHRLDIGVLRSPLPRGLLVAAPPLAGRRDRRDRDRGRARGDQRRGRHGSHGAQRVPRDRGLHDAGRARDRRLSARALAAPAPPLHRPPQPPPARDPAP